MPTSMADIQQLDTEIRRVVYDAFISNGLAPRLADVAEATGASPEALKQSFGRLAEGHILVLQPGSGEILMANPFSAVPTPFLVSSKGGSWWGNCIWDGLGILAMLGGDGELQTSCPDCGERLVLRIEGGELGSTPLLAHFSVPARQWWDDIVFT